MKRDNASHDGPLARSGGGDEWERDAIAWLAGQCAAPVLPGDVADASLSRAQECFWEWLGRDAVSRMSPAERDQTAAAANRLAAQLRLRLEPHQVRRVDHGPVEMRAPIQGATGLVLARARRMGAAPLVDLAVAAGAGRTLWDEPSESWVVVPSDQQLPDRRYVALRIVGDSMIPLLHSGDTILVDLDGEVRPGAILVARGADDGGATDGYVVKRVDAVTATTLQLSSLNPTFPGLAIPSDRRHVLGPVVLRWCAHASLAPQ